MWRAIVLSAVVTGPMLILRRRILRWGATDEEAAARYPGDELVDRPCSRSTMATTLPAPPDAVWPWLVQMGADRAGWYSWDALDNGGRPSADRIEPQWQDLRIGDRVNATTDGRFYFTAAVVDRPSTLVLRSDLALPSGRPLDPTAPDPRSYTRGIWGFHLDALPGERTRLVVRTLGRDAPRPLMAVVDALLGEPAHLIMQLRQFRNLERRVGTIGERRAGAVADEQPRTPVESHPPGSH